MEVKVIKGEELKKKKRIIYAIFGIGTVCCVLTIIETLLSGEVSLADYISKTALIAAWYILAIIITRNISELTVESKKKKG